MNRKLNRRKEKKYLEDRCKYFLNFNVTPQADNGGVWFFDAQPLTFMACFLLLNHPLNLFSLEVEDSFQVESFDLRHVVSYWYSYFVQFNPINPLFEMSFLSWEKLESFYSSMWHVSQGYLWTSHPSNIFPSEHFVNFVYSPSLPIIFMSSIS